MTKNSIQKPSTSTRSQVWLAGMYLLVAALLPLYHPFAIQKEATGRPVRPATTISHGPRGALKATPNDGTAEGDTALEGAKAMSSIRDFLALNLNRNSRLLVDRMLKDEFDKGNPFYSLNNVYPVALILRKGVTSFHREVYRSPDFLSGFGYDVVKYEIQQNDGSQSYILAYKEKTAPAQVAIGQADQRPLFSMFLVPQDQDLIFASLYQDGKPVTNQTLARSEAMAMLASRVDPATPLLSSRDDR